VEKGDKYYSEVNDQLDLIIKLGLSVSLTSGSRAANH
jgi:hypothetical protein